MSKTAVVFKREFLEFVRSKTFVVMTLIGPLLIAGFFALEIFVLTRGGGGEYKMAVVDQSAENVGQGLEAALKNARGFMGKATTFNIKRIDHPANLQALRDSLDGAVEGDSLGGYLIIPPGIVAGDTAHYFGKNATNQNLTVVVGNTLEQVVQSIRFGREGIDQGKVAAAMRPVHLKSEKTGGGGMKGNAEAAQVLAMLMSFAIYLSIALYGAAIMNSVLEEKRDKIVEVISSSVPAPQMVIGKVLGIGAAGLLQMLVWAVSVGLALKFAGNLAGLIVSDDKAKLVAMMVAALPKIPLSVGAIFILFFFGGFLIFSSMYASIGAISTDNREAQQMVFPAMMPLLIGYFMAMTAMRDADAQMVKIGSFIPFTSPMVMPIRAVLGSATLLDAAIALALVVGTAFFMLWVAGKIYRVGIFATGKKPTMKEVVRWIKTA